MPTALRQKRPGRALFLDAFGYGIIIAGDGKRVNSTQERGYHDQTSDLALYADHDLAPTTHPEIDAIIKSNYACIIHLSAFVTLSSHFFGAKPLDKRRYFAMIAAAS